MSRRGTLQVIGVAAALLLTRSWWLPGDAPTWLRGQSPFTWSETRRERQHCLAFAEMIGSQHPAMYYIDEDRKAKPVTSIDRTIRAGDSLAFDGSVARGRYLSYVFHCATANLHGRPGDHRSEIAEPWSGANDWASVHAVEERLHRLCVDSLAARHPTMRFSERTLMLRRAGGGGRLLTTALDTVYAGEPETMSCAVWVGGDGRISASVEDPGTQF